MSVFERVEENKKRLRPKLEEELAAKPLSGLLRRETWGDHDRAQFSPFELSLAEGTITKEGYAQLIANVYPVYWAMESRLNTLADDPIVGQFHIPELARVPFLEKDLEYFYGPEWKSKAAADLLESTNEYVQRVLAVDSIGFVAHHYTRYMADLSGGLMIAAALRNAWGTDEGLAYYDFSAIGDAVGFKNAYRQALNDLPLDVEGKLQLIFEVMAAYEFNIQMGAELAELHIAVGA
jgi:heme oxygenase (biliverdin-producing, ferredoxin)